MRLLFLYTLILYYIFCCHCKGHLITQLTGLTDKWFYKLIKDGGFPAPIKMGRSSRWLKSEVEAWLQARIAQSRP